MILNALALKLKRQAHGDFKGRHFEAIRIRGQWRYLYRAIDKHGTPIDFLLTAKRDLEAAKRFFRKMLREEPLLAPDRIGTEVPIRQPSLRAGRRACYPARRPTTSPSTCSRGLRATTSGSRDPCRG